MMVPLQGLDQQVVDRKPDRTAPVGVSPEIPGGRLSGCVGHLKALSIGMKDKRALPVKCRNRSDPERGEKLAFVEQVAEHATEALLGGDGQQSVSMSHFGRLLFHAGGDGVQIFPVLQKPVHSLAKRGQSVDHRAVDDLNGDQRQQSDQGPDLQGNETVVDVQMIIVKPVFFIPEAGAVDGVDGVGDGDEVFEELGGDVLVGRVLAGQLQGHGEHGGAEKGHPGRAVGLLQMPAGGQRFGPIEHPDIVQAEKTAGKHMVAVGVFPVHPPGEVEQQLLEHPGEKLAVPTAGRTGHLVNPPGRPGVHGRIDVVEGKLVGRKLAVGVHVPLAQE